MKIQVDYERGKCFGKECMLRFECSTCAVKGKCFEDSMTLAFG